MRASDVLRVAVVAGAVVAAAASATVRPHQAIDNCLSDEYRNKPVSIGHYFNAARVPDMIPGDSTLDDATCALGQPQSFITVGDTHLVTWMFGAFSSGHAESVTISFDGRGVMIGVTGSSSSR